MPRFGRLITAMITPFTPSGEVDFDRAADLAKHVIASGSDGLVVSGTTGESPVLSEDEKLELYRVVKRAVGTAAVIAGTGSYNTAESIHLTREAERCGVDGCLLVVPYYNNPPQEGLYRHFKAIAQSTSLPCILYNIPSRSPRNLEPATLKRLAEIDNIIGLKEASGKPEQINAVLAAVPDGFLIYSGNDTDTFTIMSLGGHGVISVSAHLAGEQTRRMIDLLVEGRTAEAARLHHHLLPLVNALFMTANPMPLKAAMNELGYHVGAPRLPLVELSSSELEKLRMVMASYQFDPYLSRQAVPA
ncbi:MAG: 4-hydroxy-tetrahydrodipicolinate synthase [Chloroflexota bacterium]